MISEQPDESLKRLREDDGDELPTQFEPFRGAGATPPPVKPAPPKLDPPKPALAAAQPPEDEQISHLSIPELDDPLLGCLIAGRYQIEGHINRGGMGAVYRARSGRQLCAVKILKPFARRVGEVEIARFKREAAILKGLNCPNIVACHDAGQVVIETRQGKRLEFFFIVMDLVAGPPERQGRPTNLLDLLGAGPMALTTLAPLFDELCQALALVHDQRIVHRDLKPQNIMIDPQRRPVVVDFGIAKRFDGAMQTTLTRTGCVINTPDYAAPEQSIPQYPIDHRADIYALGLLLYQMLTGQLPPAGRNPQDAYVLRPEDFPSQLRRKEVGKEVDRVLFTALAQDPQQRYRGATELRIAFRRALRMARWERRFPYLLAAAAVILVAALLVFL